MTKLIDMNSCLGRINVGNHQNGKYIGLVILQQADINEIYVPPSEIYINHIGSLKNLRDALDEAIKEHDGL